MALQGHLGKYHMSCIPASTVEVKPRSQPRGWAINLVTDGKSRILFTVCRAPAIPVQLGTPPTSRALKLQPWEEWSGAVTLPGRTLRSCLQDPLLQADNTEEQAPRGSIFHIVCNATELVSFPVWTGGQKTLSTRTAGICRWVSNFQADQSDFLWHVPFEDLCFKKTFPQVPCKNHVWSNLGGLTLF